MTNENTENKGVSMDVDQAKGELRTFVVHSLGKPDLDDRDDIFEVGEATSLYSMELVLFIEEKLGIPLEDEDLERDNFATIGAMTRLIGSKWHAR
jgi:acyl carrier protein